MAGDGVGGSSTGYEFKPINHKKRALEADEADEASLGVVVIAARVSFSSCVPVCACV